MMRRVVARGSLVRLLRSAAKAAGLVVCLVLSLGGMLAIACVVTFPRTELGDFCQEWTSGRNFLCGYPVYLDLDQSLPIHIGPDASSILSCNPHPPTSVLLAMGLALWDYTPAYLAWSAISVVCLVAGIGLIVRNARPELTGLECAVLVTLVATGSALRHQMFQGQWNLVLLLLIVGVWVADRRRGYAASGALLGLAAAIKLFPAFLLLYYVADRRWRAVAAAGGVFLACNGVCLAMFGPQTFVDYVLRAAPSAATFREAWLNASLLGFWSKLFDGGCGDVVPLVHAPLAASLLTFFSWIALALLTLYAASGARRQSQRDLAFASCTVAMLLASPITWDHYFVMLILPFVIVWQAQAGSAAGRAATLAAAFVLLTLNPGYVWQAVVPGFLGPQHVAPRVGPASVLTGISLQFYVLLGFYGLVLRRLWAVRAAGVVYLPDAAHVRPQLVLQTLRVPAFSRRRRLAHRGPAQPADVAT